MPDKVFYRVDITESEAGWGSRTDESIYFVEKVDAEKYAKDYNDRYNIADKAPSWYMMAESPVADIMNAEQVKKIRADKTGRRSFYKPK